MKVGRTILALIGLIAIALTYATRNIYFLAVAVIVFFVGLAIMGAIRKPEPKNENVKRRQKN